MTLMPKCNHLFHTRCCQQWLNYRFRCPNCNLAINFDEEEEKAAESEEEEQEEAIFEEDVDEDLDIDSEGVLAINADGHSDASSDLD